MADPVKTPVSNAFAGAASDVLATAITNYNTAATAAMAAAIPLAIVPAIAGTPTQSSGLPTFGQPQVGFDGTSYFIIGSVNYNIYV